MVLQTTARLINTKFNAASDNLTWLFIRSDGALLTAVCVVQAVSSGYGSPIGGVTLNTLAQQLQGFGIGFNILELDVGNCSISKFQEFNTCGSGYQATAMADYISDLPKSTVLVGVTSDEAVSSLNAAARSALLAIGVDVSGLQFRGKVSFIAQVGRPSVALMKMETSPTINYAIGLTADVRCKYSDWMEV